MNNNRSWYFEETCPSCDETHTYHFSEVDEYGFIICKFCGCKMHACTMCDNHDNCSDCDEHDATKSRWRSDEMSEYLRYRLDLAAEKQVIFCQYLKAQGNIIKALYDDEVGTEAFKSLINKQRGIEPEFVEDTVYTDKAGDAWFRHRGFDFHILRLRRYNPKDGDGDTGKLTVACENMSGFYPVPNCWCDYFDVTADDAYFNICNQLLPEIDRWIDSNNKEIK